MSCKISDSGAHAAAMSLAELNALVRKAIGAALPATYWVRAETSDVRVNAASGHCYLEFIDKDERAGGQITAKARGIIWARTFQMIKPYFERETGQSFRSGLKVLVKVSIVFHEVYGYSLNVCDVDPSYTLGDLVRKRQEILLRLQREGILNLNKELPFPALPQRIAVVTSPTAAGLEDFCDQLAKNKEGFPFYIKLFPAVMQGEKTEESLIDALDRIFSYAGYFDVAVIIRGGGSTSDLSCFDSYLLAVNCAQFPLPIITGIGHERDDTVVDRVAHTRMKTPTAVASFLIECMSREAGRILALEDLITTEAAARLTREKAALQQCIATFPPLVESFLEKRRSRLLAMTVRLSVIPQGLLHRMETVAAYPLRIRRATEAMLARQATLVEAMPTRLRSAFDSLYAAHCRKLDMNGQFIKMASPEYILQRGYTLTVKDGKIIKHAGELAEGDEITIRFYDGERKGTII